MESLNAKQVKRWRKLQRAEVQLHVKHGINQHLYDLEQRHITELKNGLQNGKRYRIAFFVAAVIAILEAVEIYAIWK